MKAEFMVERSGKRFCLYAGLLDEAHGQGLKGIETMLLQIPSADNGNVAICRAEVTTEKGVFTGIGDASPDNVARMMVPHIIRMAETRAKARALRDAVNVGVAALEEIGDDEHDAPKAAPPTPIRPAATTPAAAAPAGPRKLEQVFDPQHGGSATENQIRAIYKISRDRQGRDEGQTDEDATKLYGVPVAQLTKRQASDFIGQLQG